jgi:hypothetical protein
VRSRPAADAFAESAELPSVAVIIPCWNAEAWIGRAIRSILDQNYPALELVVIDDGSTDSSLDVIRSFGNHLRWETGPNRGASAARNRGLEIADADYVLFHDADDYLEGGFLRSLAMAAQAARADICFGPSCREYTDGSRRPRPTLDLTIGHVGLLADMLRGKWAPAHSILWKSAFLRRVGGWNATALRNQDGELLCRAMLLKPAMGVAREGSAVYVQHTTTARVSGRWSQAVAQSQLASIEAFVVAVADGEFAPVLPYVGANAYGLATRCFQHNYSSEGRQALALARRCGFSGHPGTPAHRLASTLLGLELKQRLSGAWNSVGRKRERV